MVFLSAPKQIGRAPDWLSINLECIHTNTLGTPTFVLYFVTQQLSLHEAKGIMGTNEDNSKQFNLLINFTHTQKLDSF